MWTLVVVIYYSSGGAGVSSALRADKTVIMGYNGTWMRGSNWKHQWKKMQMREQLTDRKDLVLIVTEAVFQSLFAV